MSVVLTLLKTKGMKSEIVYHVYSRSSKVVFRGEDDYLMAINRLFTCAHATGTKVLAYAIMSTHFHLVVRTRDPYPFMVRYKRCVAIWHKARYKKKIKVEVASRELLNSFEIKTALNYVLKNPMHHRVAMMAIQYPYSSAHCYFKGKLQRRQLYVLELKALDLHQYCKASDLDWKTRRIIFGKYMPNPALLIQDNRVVVPESFLDIFFVQSVYSHEREFSYQMSKSLKEELDFFCAEGEGPGDKQAVMDLCEKMTDQEVCELIDRTIAPLTYAELSDAQKEALWHTLYRKGVSRAQFERAV